VFGAAALALADVVQAVHAAEHVGAVLHHQAGPHKGTLLVALGDQGRDLLPGADFVAVLGAAEHAGHGGHVTGAGASGTQISSGRQIWLCRPGRSQPCST
jgi:hypothetical protein